MGRKRSTYSCSRIPDWDCPAASTCSTRSTPRPPMGSIPPAGGGWRKAWATWVKISKAHSSPGWAMRA
jgi:hypothetical protein